jgi:very-short-patch-repair endonuclease
MHKIITNSFHNKKVRIILIDDEPWFVAKDVANVLGYIRKDGRVDTNAMIRKLDSDDVREIADEFESSSKMSRKLAIINKVGLIKLVGITRKISRKEKLHFLNTLGVSSNVLVMQSFKETEFGEMLIDTLSGFNPNIKIIRQFNVLQYNIDFYVPKYKIAIEFDEISHKHRTQEDTRRESRIKNILQCEFIRIKENDNLHKKIGEVLAKLV